jgi:predicted permease
MILLIINILFPLFFIILIGWYAGKKGIVKEEHSKSLVNFIILLATPALLFNMTTSNPIESFLNFNIVIVISIGLLLTYIKTYIIYHYKFKKHPKETSQASLISAFPNAAFMGIPIISYLYGDEGIVVVVLGSLIVFLLITPITMFLIEYHDNPDHINLKSIVSQVTTLAKTPVIFAPISGLILSFFHAPIPEYITSSFKFLGNTAPAISLFTTGLFMAYTRISINYEVALLIFIRNITSPIIFYVVMIKMGITGNLFNEILIVSAMPTASTAPMFSAKFETYEKETAAVTILGTILSVFTIGGLIFFIN